MGLETLPQPCLENAMSRTSSLICFGWCVCVYVCISVLYEHQMIRLPKVYNLFLCDFAHSILSSTVIYTELMLNLAPDFM